MRLPLITSLIGTFVFFFASFITLSDYGISWDETLHWRRGQAYLYYFLTGETTYQKLPNPNLQGTSGNPKKIPSRRSFYQNDLHNGEFFLKNDSGHPPLNDELAALFNYVFFQRLGILDDIGAHHLFNITASALLVFVVVYFATQTFGVWAGLISFLALATYPLFWAESHFNIKDPPLATFFAGTVWAFYNSLARSSWRWLLLAFIFSSLALGTKFNILFLPFIIVPYLIFRYRHRIANFPGIVRTIPKPYLLTLITGPALIIGVFYGTWPFLWQHPWENLLKIINYYTGIGVGVRYQPDSFFVFGFNSYPIQWILFTTSPIILVLIGVGVISAWINRNKYKSVTLLWLLWFLVPIIRVMLPGAVIYGGVRQIIEFLPAMVLISGLGAWQILKWGGNKRVVIRSAILLSFLWPIFILVKLHPNENVYFNQLIGGLRGAKERNFPSWGNSFGSAYRQGIDWINKNVEKEAKLALIQGTPANAPLIFIRPDIDYKNANWSGIERGGEYLMELTFNDTEQAFYYAWEYVDTFLEPLYELKVDGVAILKIWKNDFSHTNKEYRTGEVLFKDKLKNYPEGKNFVLEFPDEIILSRILLSFLPKVECVPLGTGFVETSINSKDWQREKDWIPFPQVKGKQNIEGDKITFFFAARRAKFVRFVLDNQNSCVLNNPIPQVKIIERSIQ